MSLPKNKKLRKVIYEYDDERYYISDKELQSYLDNIESASSIYLTRGYTEGFKPVEWKKIKNKIHGHK